MYRGCHCLSSFFGYLRSVFLAYECTQPYISKNMKCVWLLEQIYALKPVLGYLFQNYQLPRVAGEESTAKAASEWDATLQGSPVVDMPSQGNSKTLSIIDTMTPQETGNIYDHRRIEHTWASGQGWRTPICEKCDALKSARIIELSVNESSFTARIRSLALILSNLLGGKRK